MNAKFIKIILLLSLVVLSGCVATNPTMISHSIPLGTPQEDAISISLPNNEHVFDDNFHPACRRIPFTSWLRLRRVGIMKQHGYDSGPCGSKWNWPKGEVVYCFWHDNNFLKQSSYFFAHFKDGKLVSLGPWGISSTFVVKPEPLTPVTIPITPPAIAPSPK